jgi:hypothetical protein
LTGTSVQRDIATALCESRRGEPDTAKFTEQNF